MKKIFNIIFTAYFLLILPLTVLAQIPRTLSYQGVLTDNTGQPRADGNYAFTFHLYNSASGGTAIWFEEKTLPVKSGLFSTALGDQTPFGPAVKFDRPYWLGLQVGNEPELAPRIALTSVGYSMSSLRADTARVLVASLADTTWRHSGANIYRLNGNVGIGTNSPETKLQVNAFGTDVGFRLHAPRNENNTVTPYMMLSGGYTTYAGVALQGVPSSEIWGKKDLAFYAGWNNNKDIENLNELKERMRIHASGNVGIGTINPQARLQVDASKDDAGIRLHYPDGDNNRDTPYLILTGGYNRFSGVAIRGILSPEIWGKKSLVFYAGWDGYKDIDIIQELKPRMIIRSDGNVGIGTMEPSTKLDVAGRTKTCVLEITGDCDLAEPFEISHPEPLPAGALVVIDKDNPGKLKLATEPYNKRVAGVISGAGGVNPGLTLSQEGVLAGGQHVALTGKVYALATAANGAIEPGDLLTTSNVPGHAMKASDQTRWPGAVIGKAMSNLNEGEGLVLVLVNLQ